MRMPQRRVSAAAATRPARAFGFGPALFLLLMLAAFLGQSIATQSHIHFANDAAFSRATALPGTSAKPALTATHAPIESPADCPLCRELATGGHYLLPDVAALFEGRASPFWLFVLPAAILVRRQRSHRWQSRAPPQ